MSAIDDVRPDNCRFRQQEEGRLYPRSSCEACGKSVFNGLGVRCHLDPAASLTNLAVVGENLTLRDWFAGQASEADINNHNYEVDYTVAARHYTREEARYRYADAMLAARKEPK